MKRFLIAILLLMVAFIATKAQLRYQCQGAPEVEVTVVSGGVMVDIDGASSAIMLYPQGFLSCYMYYIGNGISALFTSDLTSMLLSVGGSTYQ